MFNNYSEVKEIAKAKLLGICNVCPDCNGLACRGKVPGCGSKGEGAAFIDSRAFIKSIKLNMDAVHEHFEADTKISLFGKEFELPFCIAPVGGMSLNYGSVMSEYEYAKAVISGAKDKGIFAWTGDGPNDDIFYKPLEAIKEVKEGCAVVAVKPWEQEKVFARIKEAEEAGAIAIAMDIDAASLINLKLAGKPVYTKSEDELREIVRSTKLPFIVKGVLTKDAAIRCANAGCYGIVLSNHGGRIMEDAAAPASLIPEIRAAAGDRLKIFVDGGIRTGSDIFKCIALGADCVMLARPFVTAAVGGGEEGVGLLIDKLSSELKETMLMTDSRNISSIGFDKIRYDKFGL